MVDSIRLGMPHGQAAIVAAHFVQLVIFAIVFVLSAKWLCKRCATFINDPVGLIILSAFVSAGNRLLIASVYSTARIAKHTNGYDAWSDLAWLMAVTKIAPIAAGILFAVGALRLLHDKTCEEVRGPFMVLSVSLAAVWAVAFWLLS